MKIIKKLTAIALATCMALFFTAAAQTVENEEDTAKVGNFIVTDTISDIESKADENGLVHWSDVLGYGIETVQNELAENHPSESAHGENRISPYGNETIGTFTKEELEEMGAWEIGMGSYEPYTSEEAEFIIDRLLEIKEPEDSIAFDHGDIYLDIRWRGKTISSEGFPSYMPYEDASASANPLSLDPYSRAEELPDYMIPWYDALGITLEQLREEMAQNPPELSSERVTISDNNENVELTSLSPEEQHEFLCSLSPEELASLLDYGMEYTPMSPEEQAAFELERPQKHTPKESREIRRRLMEIKYPNDLICSDRGEIYLDIRWRDKKAPQ